MSQNEKARVGVGAPTRAGAEMATGLRPISVTDFTTAGVNFQGPIASLLPLGAENAIPTVQLVRLSGSKDARTLQRRIEAERAEGNLILSRSGPGGGYYLPDVGEKGQREIAMFVATLRARAISTLRSLRAARLALEVIEGQLDFGEGGGGECGETQDG